MKRRALLIGALTTPLVAKAKEASMHAPWIHFVGDGRPPREVFVDGIRIERAIYADGRKGIVRYHRQPLVVRDGEIVTTEVRGRVEVREIGR